MTEHDLQVQCVKWFHLLFPEYRKLFWATPNGGHRSKAAAGKMKAEGQMPGVPDLQLMVPKFLAVIEKVHGGDYRRLIPEHHGLFIEMKMPGNYATKIQKQVHEALRIQGYHVEVCKSLEEFAKTVCKYLGCYCTCGLSAPDENNQCKNCLMPVK